VNGVVTNRYGDAFIRGNNGALTLSLIKKHIVSEFAFLLVLYISAAELI
jgi:hypothetical protein